MQEEVGRRAGKDGPEGILGRHWRTVEGGLQPELKQNLGSNLCPQPGKLVHIQSTPKPGSRVFLCGQNRVRVWFNSAVKTHC